MPTHRLFALALTVALAHSAWACATVRPPPPVPQGEDAKTSGAPPAARAQADMTPTEGSVAESNTADPTVTDPDNYHLVMENQRVRVLRYHDVPGTKTHPHRHPDSVLYALSAFRRRLHFPDGTTRDRDFQPGDVMWVPAQTHVGENIGATDTEVLLVEIRTP